MTGGGYIPPADDDDHTVQWVGTPGVKGPRWARLPLLTVGMLGTQVVWSVEMAYASPFLIQLGLSKAWMSLVFMAGPLSGLIVQPLIGAYADRSRSRFGRRRPFMLAGTGVAVVAMLMLGWAKEIAGLFGLGNKAAIACAVFAIYLIDFSINAVMSTDRALIVDTLPPAQQEDGNAWGGRMMGVGAVAGFLVGNFDLPSAVPFLGNSQLQILSLLTSVVLALAHTSTSWAVTERVLLRDDRQQSRSGLWSSLRAIWDNMFKLPRDIRTICFIQFFANLGWYPILFFTSIWVMDIYRDEHPLSEFGDGEAGTAAWTRAAERAGSRAMFFQAVVSLCMSVCAPFLVAGSGVQDPAGGSGYARLAATGANGDDDDEEGSGSDTPNSAMWKAAREQPRGLLQRMTDAAGSAAGTVGNAFRAAAETIGATPRRGVTLPTLPIKGLTLIRLWVVAQCIFVACMFASWFTRSVGGAYTVIGITGFAWALAQWAPFALLGELVLIDPESDVHAAEAHEIRALRAADSTVLFAADPELGEGEVHSRASRNHSPDDEHPPTPAPRTLRHTRVPSHATVSTLSEPLDELDTTVVLRHSTDELTPLPPGLREPAPKESSTADQAGLILGIHNVFIVMPQFVITGVASVVFALMEGGKTEPPAAGADGVVPPTEHTPSAVGLVFRIGGMAAVVGAFLSYRLSRRWASR